jgi:hypothetical protein
MKWVARERVTVDRVACPCLIRKFVDRVAVLWFVPADQVPAVAEREGAKPCDALYACCQHMVRRGKPGGAFKD